MLKLSFADQETIKSLLRDGATLTGVAKLYVCDRSVIRRICLEAGIPIPLAAKDKYPFSPEEIRKICDCYVGNMTLQEIADQLSIHRGRAKRALLLAGIALRKCTTTRINEEYFKSIDSEAKAYLLGFIYADGCVFNSKGTQGFRVQIKASDFAVLQFMQQQLETDYPICYIKRHDRAEDQVSLTVTNRYLTQQLIALGCVPRKSKTLMFPSICDDLIPHFLRGYYDGDGSLGSSHKHYVHPSLSICLSQNFGETLSEVIRTLNIKSRFYPCRNIWKVTLQRKHALRFLDYIYSFNTFCLERKFSRYQFFKRYYENSRRGCAKDRMERHTNWILFKGEEAITKEDRLHQAYETFGR